MRWNAIGSSPTTTPGCAANSPKHSASNANHPRRLRGSATPVTLPQRSDPVDGRLRRHGGHVNDTVLDVTAQVNDMSILKAGDNGGQRDPLDAWGPAPPHGFPP